ncbi:MAG: rod shape-determining protein MreC [Gammaproteobacteria bacterium]|nr:rod shape-determining protein MreC [Gammaproteobacteria bacterium]
MQKLELRSALVAILAVAFIGIESNSDMLHNVREVLYLTVKPIVEVSQVPVAVNKVVQRHFVDREILRQRISTIAQENAELRDRVNELEYQELRSKWLADLLEVREQIEYPVLTANLVSVQLMPMSHKIVLDRGAQQQVYVGQPVLDSRGLIGQVTEMTRTDSAVTLITDSSHSVPVRLQRNGLLAIAHGLGLHNQLLISGLRLNQDVEVGDILITSGLGNRFPAGHPVAEITRVEGDPNSSFAEIIAAPLATIDPDFEVLMVWNNDRDSLDSISTLTLNENLDLQR